MTETRQNHPPSTMGSAEPVKVTGQPDEAKPNEARMSEIAKRLLSTPPDRQSVGKALAPKKLSNDVD